LKVADYHLSHLYLGNSGPEGGGAWEQPFGQYNTPTLQTDKQQSDSIANIHPKN